LHVNLGTGSEDTGRLELMDISGKVMMLEDVPAGTRIFRLNMASLTSGLYFLRWVDAGQVRGVSKVVKTR
ncbi:MAG TPA: T9SS type A sorting domain-containing protein, partial [Bacteroides sp.]|nr:T9SS type A sorting domain-containing protein [Bacteroides sp.]